MSRTKLKKFKKLNNMSHVIQPVREDLLSDNFQLKGSWAERFKNKNPIVLELGCGKGEYTIDLAKNHPEYNYIGIDIKGARIYSGAERASGFQLNNVLFIRTQIEYLEFLFDKNEVSEIWITFPDPQIKFNRRKKRLTCPRFLKVYNQILKKGGSVHLKTDSQFLHGYTLALLESGPYNILKSMHDIYSVPFFDDRLNIKTHYEKMFLSKNTPITYIHFSFL